MTWGDLLYLVRTHLPRQMYFSKGENGRNCQKCLSELTLMNGVISLRFMNFSFHIKVVQVFKVWCKCNVMCISPELHFNERVTKQGNPVNPKSWTLSVICWVIWSCEIATNVLLCSLLQCHTPVANTCYHSHPHTLPLSTKECKLQNILDIPYSLFQILHL